MLARLLDGTARGARRAAVVAVALAVGVVVGASALAGHPTRLATVADGTSASAPVGSEHAHASKAAKSHKAKATTAPESSRSHEAAGDGGDEAKDGSGVHGACVAAVAQNATKVGGPHHNHGYVVSRAAHTCPNPQPSATE